MLMTTNTTTTRASPHGVNSAVQNFKMPPTRTQNGPFEPSYLSGPALHTADSAGRRRIAHGLKNLYLWQRRLAAGGVTSSARGRWCAWALLGAGGGDLGPSQKRSDWFLACLTSPRAPARENKFTAKGLLKNLGFTRCKLFCFLFIFNFLIFSFSSSSSSYFFFFFFFFFFLWLLLKVF